MKHPCAAEAYHERVIAGSLLTSDLTLHHWARSHLLNCVSDLSPHVFISTKQHCVHSGAVMLTLLHLLTCLVFLGSP